jgi:hypothetical protein
MSLRDKFLTEPARSHGHVFHSIAWDVGHLGTTGYPRAGIKLKLVDVAELNVSPPFAMFGPARFWR